MPFYCNFTFKWSPFCFKTCQNFALRANNLQYNIQTDSHTVERLSCNLRNEHLSASFLHITIEGGMEPFEGFGQEPRLAALEKECLSVIYNGQNVYSR